MEAETPELSQDIFVLEEGCVVGPLESLGEFQGEAFFFFSFLSTNRAFLDDAF